MDLQRMRSFVSRHRQAVKDLSFIAIGTVLALYWAYSIDIFVTEGAVDARESRIELDELILIGALLSLALLVFSIRQYLAQRREIARRIVAERQVRELAYQDVLTGLPNRRQYDDALRNAIAAPPRAGAEHGVFLLDLNGFKQINDVYGHAVGDEVLIVVAQRLLSAMRGDDIVARFGGDEFAILATHLAGPEAATNVALRVIDALEAPIEAGGVTHRVGAGIGVALVPMDAVTADEALRMSDVALYRAKAERRSAMRFFEPEMDARVRGRAALEAALRAAMEADRIETLYVPTVNLKTREVAGFDAVPRWLDPEHGEVARDRFIAIAEEVGLIHALAERLLRRACETAVSWPAHVKLAVDLYPSQLKDRQWPAHVLRILGETGLSPARLEIEITESALVADTDNARTTLGALRAGGVRISLDNFGSGYSSLYHLRNVQVDKIKIDSSFVQAMGQQQEGAGIMSALIGLGQGFGFTVAADGVSGIEQEHSLLATGCEQGQGQLFSAPVSAAEALQLIG